MTKPIGVDFKVQVVSVDKLTEITTQQGQRQDGAGLRHVHLGLGRRPYDPSLLLNLLTTKAIGGSSDSFYSNPEYDQLYDQQAGEFDQRAQGDRQQMIALSQRDLPYLVLTVDPTCRPTAPTARGVERSCPQPAATSSATRSATRRAAIEPPSRRPRRRSDGGSNG
jgi:ABC-type transport system substrate-binding protein